MAFYKISILLVLFFINIQASFIEQNTPPIVYHNDDFMPYAWNGGLNSPQFSEIDLNQDGWLDLLVYDQKGADVNGRILCYLNNGNTEQPYKYEPLYTPTFTHLSDASYITAKDFNKDQIPDLFVTLPGDRIGLLIYEGYYTDKNHYAFTLRQRINDYAIDDLRKPSIVDVDGDGFLDILKLNTADDGINFFRNLQRDTLAFELEECWGNFTKVPLTNEVILDNECSHTPTEGKKPPHFFSVLSTFDVDKDNDIDLFLSNSGSSTLTYVVNGGSQEQSIITDFQYDFPTPNPISIYSSAYVQEMDLNNDGTKEWLITPQDPDNAATIKNVHVYAVKEQQKDQMPVIELLNDSFLVEDMIDVGELSHPVFFDYNQDGLMDLVISNYRKISTENQAKSNLTLLKNVGTPTKAAFEIISEDYLGLSEEGYFGMVPAFGDLDGDGDEDMVLTTLFKNYLFYFQNNPDENGIAQFTLVNDQLLKLNNILNKSPFLADINQDGLLDFIMGKNRGTIHYYQNIGSSDEPAFELVTEFWGQVNAQIELTNISNPTPIVNGWDNDGVLDLFLGDIYGHVQHYLVDAPADSAFTLVSKELENIAVGHRSTIAMHDLDGDGLQELLLGSFSGGLTYFSQKANPIGVGLPESTTITTQAQLDLYPNPTNHQITLVPPSTAHQSAPVRLYDHLGRLVLSQLVDGGGDYRIDVESLVMGVYIVEWGGIFGTFVRLP